MGQCNSTEGIQTPAQPAGGAAAEQARPNGRVVQQRGRPQPSWQPAPQPAKEASPSSQEQDDDPQQQERVKSSAACSTAQSVTGDASELSVARSPLSILKTGKSRAKGTMHVGQAQSAHFSASVLDTVEQSPKLIAAEMSDGGRERTSKVRLAVPEKETPPAPPPPPAPAPLRFFDHNRSWVFKETEDVAKFYTFSRVLGQGQFGTTRLVTELSTGKEYACKSISKKKLKREDEVEDVRREVQILHHLEGHPHVIRIKGVYEDRRHVHIVMELASGGELFERMSKKGRYSEMDAAAVFRTMVEVVAHCHNMGVMHRDLKPENFLLMSEASDAQLKATDFGLSTFFREGQKFKEIVGSALYVAPEVLKREYSKEADVWSLGVILYILLSGTPPFMAETEEKVFRKVLRSAVDMRSKPWPLISEEAKDCVKQMLERDPQKRASAAQILQHPWVREDGTASDQPMQFEVLVRLQGFSNMNKLKKEAVKIIASLLPEDEIIGLREIFKSIDLDNSGAISIAELREGLMRKGTVIPEGQLRKLMEYVDINGNGNLDYDEFIAATLNQSKIEQEAYMLRAFQQFDADNSGYITQEELFDALNKHNVPTAELQAILKQVDRNGDGLIDYEEFCYMMRQAEQLADFERKSHSSQASQASEALGHGDPRLLSRQNSDYVRPSWAIQGGSRGDHVFNLTSELEVKVHRQSLLRAMSKKRRSVGDGVDMRSSSSHSLKLDRGSDMSSKQPMEEEEEEEEGATGHEAPEAK